MARSILEFPENQLIFCRGLKRQNPPFIVFPIRSNQGQTYILTYFLPTYLPPTCGQAYLVYLILKICLGEWDHMTLIFLKNYTSQHSRRLSCPWASGTYRVTLALTYSYNMKFVLRWTIQWLLVCCSVTTTNFWTFWIHTHSRSSSMVWLYFSRETKPVR